MLRVDSQEQTLCVGIALFATRESTIGFNSVMREFHAALEVCVRKGAKLNSMNYENDKTLRKQSRAKASVVMVCSGQSAVPNKAGRKWCAAGKPRVQRLSTPLSRYLASLLLLSSFNSARWQAGNLMIHICDTGQAT